MTSSPRPFLTHSAELLPVERQSEWRYDTARSVSQVLIAGRWIDSVNAPESPQPQTRKTDVGQETTDDD